MGLFDKIKEIAEEVTEQVSDVLPEFDPTSPNATFGDVTQVVGETVVSTVTMGAGTGLFSTVTEGIGALNQATDNAFTVNNIGETVDTFTSEAPDVLNEVIADPGSLFNTVDPDTFINEVLPEFDPTSPNATFGDATQAVGDAVFNTMTGGAGSDLFSTVTEGIGELNQVTNNAFTVNNIGETTDTFISEAPDFLGNVASNPDLFIDEVLPEFDPTNPNASFGDETQAAGEAVVTTVIGDTGSGWFSTATGAIGELNQATDNAFTVDNIGETADSFIDSASAIQEPCLYPEPSLIDEVASDPVGSIEDLHSEINDIVDFSF